MRETIVLGALLHDIGKVIYHALSPNERYGKRHQELGHTWAAEVGMPEAVREIIRRHHFLRGDDPKYRELATQACKGPTGLRNTLWLVGEADNLASAMERTREEGGEYAVNQGLGVVFDRLSLSQPRAISHLWQPCLQEKRPYPRPAAEVEESAVAEFYRQTWQSLRDCLGDPANRQEDRLLLVLEKYLTTVPEHTYTSGEERPDTSLFHHLRSTAAIAWSNYLYLLAQGRDWEGEDCSEAVGWREEERYLLIGADLSGIQKFIYTIASKAALKTLRARSFYLELLVESAAVQLYRALDLGRFSLVYASGGGFYLLGANTPAARQTLATFKTRFNGWLYANFGPALYLNLAARPLTGLDLSNDAGRLSIAWSELHRELQGEKSHRWLPQLEEDFESIMVPHEVGEECAACHGDREVEGVILDDTEIKLCRFCRDMLSLGRDLPKIERFYEVPPGAHHGSTVEVADCAYLLVSLASKK